ncbi:unnamed protein product [Cladocopium goreaui]|uniref:CUB and sushi domain-containing protein 1 n=1 Tax=Cladocopium goreaui TaxID=2562237 RepID=A0A9P1FG11_9DINO|nr:unnamed protein product [Cladocopium goreaui]
MDCHSVVSVCRSSTLDVIHSSTWRHCFRHVLGRPLENHGMLGAGGTGPSASSSRSVRNGVFRRLLSRFYAGDFMADYDAFFFMEIDAVPVRAWWIEQLLLETVETKTATASAIRGSGYRGDLFEDGPFNGAERLEIRYVNGNAIYNLRHPWLRWLHSQLEKEASEVDSWPQRCHRLRSLRIIQALASIDFDVRIGSSSFRDIYSALVAPGEEPYRSDSRLIGSFGNALLNQSFESNVYVRQVSVNNILYNLEDRLTLSIAAYGDEYQELYASVQATHPFRSMLVMSYGHTPVRPDASSELILTANGATEVQFRSALNKNRRHLAVCDMASVITTKYFAAASMENFG